MDKYEYKVRADEIKDLIAQGEYVQAVEIADTIDWRRVKSVMMLCTISDLYKINRRYEDARNMLLLAYERRPGGRTICYSLCELSIKMEDFVPAVNYYKEFVQVAPKDPGRYILQYKLYEAQDVSLEERIGVLEELKKRDYREKWAYELAYLYHRVGLATRCVEECDELILWFGEGKYVIKAMELKMLHQPLSPSQQEKYDHRFEEPAPSYYEPQQEADAQKQAQYEPQQAVSLQGQPFYAAQQGEISQEALYYEASQGTAPQEAVYYETPQGAQTQEGLYYETPQGAQTQEAVYYETPQGAQTQEGIYYETPQGVQPQEGLYYEAAQGVQSQEALYYGTAQGTVPQEQSYGDVAQGTAPDGGIYYESRQGAAQEESFYYETAQGEPSQEQAYYVGQQGMAVQEPPYYVQSQGTSQGYEVGGKTKIYESVSQDQFSGQGIPAGQGYHADFSESHVAEPPEELDIQVKPVDLGQYNTINLQAEIAAGLKEVLEDDRKAAMEDEITRTIVAPMIESETESLDLPEIDEVDENDLEPEAEVMEDSEVFFGETGEIGDLQQLQGRLDAGRPVPKEIVPEIGSERKAGRADGLVHHAVKEADLNKETVDVAVYTQDEDNLPASDITGAGRSGQLSGPAPTAEQNKQGAAAELSGQDSAEAVTGQPSRESREEQVLTAQPPKEMASVLSQESDGQISMVVPENELIEKQITGQMNLEDILVEWERMKQENAEKRKEEVRQHVLQHTGEMFTAFEASVRDGLLEQLEGNQAPNSGADFGEEESVAVGEPTEKDVHQDIREEIPPEGPEEEYLEENEDWDSVPQGTPQELDAILKEAEREVTSGEAEEPEGEQEPEGAGEYEELAEEPEAEFDEPEEGGEYEELVKEPEAEFEEPEEGGEYEELGEEPEAEPEEFEEGGEYEELGEEPEAEPEELEEGGGYEALEDRRETGEPAAQKPQSNKAGKSEKKKPEVKKPEAKKPAAVKQENPAGEMPAVEREKGKVRSLTKEEKELYGPYIQSRASREQLVQAIDNISMAAYTGNIIITGEEGMDTVSLAKNMIREVQMTDSNFAGKVAKISGQALNKKDVETTINQLASGALIIQKASGMDADTVKRLYKSLQQESFGIIIIMEDVKKAMGKFLAQYPKLAACFTARMDVESLSNGTLVAFGRKYAREREYSIDDMGILALHTRIDEMQTSDHVVTVLEVKEIVDNAIQHANRKTVKHFFDILFARRYDEEDMIILSERDFV